MPVNYMDYVKQVRDPMESVISGYSQGLNIRRAQSETAVNEAKAQQAGAQQESIQAMNADLFALSEKENPTVQDYTSLITKYPDLSAHYSPIVEGMRTEAQKSDQEEALTIFNAIETGQVDIAKDLLKNKIEAARNSGDEQEAAGAMAMFNTLEINPSLAKVSAGTMLAATMGGDQFAKVFGTLGEQRRKRELHPLELKKLRKEVEDGGSISSEKKFEMERGMKKDTDLATSDYATLNRQYQIMNVADDTGAGDMAIVFAFMKMLDPNSVVRESEYAEARNAAPPLSRLSVGEIKKWFEKGNRLSAVARADFIKQGKKVADITKKGYDGIIKQNKRIAKEFGLNPENVFYERGDAPEPKAPTPEQAKGESYLNYADTEPAQGAKPDDILSRY